jgi:hypothetical protein
MGTKWFDHVGQVMHGFRTEMIKETPDWLDRYLGPVEQVHLAALTRPAGRWYYLPSSIQVI